MQNTYVLGTASYTLASGVAITGQYDVTGAAYYLGVTNMPGSCSGGVYTISGQSSQDLNGSIYFSSYGAESSRALRDMRRFSFRNIR